MQWFLFWLSKILLCASSNNKTMIKNVSRWKTVLKAKAEAMRWRWWIGAFPVLLQIHFPPLPSVADTAPFLLQVSEWWAAGEDVGRTNKSVDSTQKVETFANHLFSKDHFQKLSDLFLCHLNSSVKNFLTNAKEISSTKNSYLASVSDCGWKADDTGKADHFHLWEAEPSGRLLELLYCREDVERREASGLLSFWTRCGSRESLSSSPSSPSPSPVWPTFRQVILQ